ncbi:hypothetical protein Tco_0707879 [Tanacetum coccineum]
MDMCYELIGYPAGFKKNLNLSKKSGNVKRFNANSGVNQSVPSTFGSISASHTNEQMMKFLVLLMKILLQSKSVMYIVTLGWIHNFGANQHLTDSTKDMFNVVDISSLMLTVDHPSGTLAKITAIGSLRSTSGIVLFDVLVVLKYNVSLVSMNKMIMDSKFFVAFDAHKCYIQDLKLGKILGSSSETDGLYLFNVNKNVCLHKDDGDIMFIEIIKKYDDSHEDGPEDEGNTTVEGLEITRRKLNPREDPNRGVSNFTGRMKGMHVFVRNFTYVIDFMIVEDISSIIDRRLSQVVLGKPFVEISNMTHDLSLGVVKFTDGINEIAYKMPYKIEQYDLLSNLEKEETKLVYLRNEEDKRRGVEYVMSKILGFYNECLDLEPEYLTGVADE